MRNFLLLSVWLWVADCATAQDRQAKFTSFDGTQVYYEVTGQGRPVLLVHGFIVNRTMWQRGPLIQSLVNAGFQVISLDLRGNGLSDKPHQLADYQNDAEAKDIMALAKHLQLRKYAVVGYSRGSIIAARLLVLDKHVQSAVLGGMGAEFTKPDWPRRWMMAEAFAGKPRPETQGALNYARSSGADTLVMNLLQQAQPVTTAAELGRIKKPVLIIAGDQDTDNGAAADLAKLLPKSTLRTVPGTHNNTAASAAFAEGVVQFLQQ